jgi:hypothetical protein
MAHLQRLGWHWRIRIKTSFWLYRRGQPRCKVERLTVARGHAGFWHQVCITAKRYGPVHLAVARPHGGTDVWYVISDEPTESKTFEEYGLSRYIGEIIQSFALFLLSKGQDYAQYTAHGRSEVVDAQAVIPNDALNLLAIMLPSFRVSYAGEQHADDLSQNFSELSALPD